MVGELDLPEELRPFEGRVVRMPFSPWRRLPQMLSFVDVNLVPLEDTLFKPRQVREQVGRGGTREGPLGGECRGRGSRTPSRTAWTACSVARRYEWYDALVRLHDSADLRSRLARAAYDECVAHHVTCGNRRPPRETSSAGRSVPTSPSCSRGSTSPAA